MFLERLHIEGYKNFGKLFTIAFSKGLNVLVGENAVGKSAIIDSVRSLLLDDDFERKPISDTDFYLPFVAGKERAASFKIECFFAGLSPTQQVAFLPWTDTDIEGKASLTLLVEKKQNSKGRYKRLLWGGASRASMFERELFDKIDCIYLPPLRDAEAKLREGRSSRLARLLKNMSEGPGGEKERERLVEKVKKFNESIASNQEHSIFKANKLIGDRLVDAIGEVFGQDTHIKFTPAEFGRIVESLRLFFFPKAHSKVDKEIFRSLEENSLGYNNLLYVATVLAELSEAKDEVSFRTLLIEEPEAHLHPQLQTRLLKYLEKAATRHSVQIIVTTHSPVLASAASVDSLIHLSRQETDEEYNYIAVPLHSCGLSDHSKQFIFRWLDVTKSTLLFARGVILVEGIAEAMLVPELAQRVLKRYNEKQGNTKKKLPVSLEDAGVAVVNMNGIYFKHFMQLFCNLEGTSGENVPVLCAGITDRDPPKRSKPTTQDEFSGKNLALKLETSINSSLCARLFVSPLKTFEYDLAMEKGNLNPMLDALLSIIPNSRIRSSTTTVWKSQSDLPKKAQTAFTLLNRIESSRIGKGLYAQILAERLKDTTVEFRVPDYVAETIIWACGGNPNEA
ncbi:MAG: AAA family ATPase [Phycisphaerae bacterium]|nr:AAA family ATPase [Phycisphaerae bacterium]